MGALVFSRVTVCVRPQFNGLDGSNPWGRVLTAAVHAQLEQVCQPWACTVFPVLSCPCVCACVCACVQHEEVMTNAHIALAGMTPAHGRARNDTLLHTAFIDVTSPFVGRHPCGDRPVYTPAQVAELELFSRLLVLRSAAITGHMGAAGEQAGILKRLLPAEADDVMLLHAQLLLEAVSTHTLRLHVWLCQFSLCLCVCVNVAQGHATAAAPLFRQCVAVNASLPAVCGLGYALYSLGPGHAGEASTHLHACVDVDPGEHKAHSVLALLCVGEGDLPKAILHATIAATLRPDYPPYRCVCVCVSVCVCISHTFCVSPQVHPGAFVWCERPMEGRTARVLRVTAWRPHVLAVSRGGGRSVGDTGEHTARHLFASGPCVPFSFTGPSIVCVCVQVATTLQPGCADVLCRLGSALLAVGSVNSATASFHLALTAATPVDDNNTHASARPLPFGLAAAQCVAMPRGRTAVCWNNAAVASLSLGYEEDAIRWLTLALQLQPDLTVAKQVRTPCCRVLSQLRDPRVSPHRTLRWCVMRMWLMGLILRMPLCHSRQRAMCLRACGMWRPMALSPSLPLTLSV